MDWSGAFFSLMAVVTQNTFDVLGGVLYIICVLLELGIFGSHLIWLARTRSIRKQLKKDGKTFDDLLGEYKERGEEWEWAEREGDMGLGGLKFWLRKDRKGEGEQRDLEEQEESDATAAGGEQGRDLEKQEDHDAAAAAGQQQGRELKSTMMMAETQKQDGSEEDTGASTPTMVDGENGAVGRT